MKRKSYFAIIFVAGLFGTAALEAQDNTAPAVLGGFETQGSATAGYRFLDTSGRKQKYLELFNLRQGFRVNEFELFGRAPEIEKRFVRPQSQLPSELLLLEQERRSAEPRGPCRFIDQSRLGHSTKIRFHEFHVACNGQFALHV